MKLSIVVPAYNEEYRLGKMLDAYLPCLTSRFDDGDVEVIVVANGCSDQTVGVAQSYTERWPMLRVMDEPEPIGKGAAVLLGMRTAKGDIVGYIDADGATPPEAMLELVDRVSDQTPAVIASRWLKDSIVSPRQTALRRLASRVFNTVVRLFFGLKLNDTQCGAKLFDRQTLERALQGDGVVTRWAFDVDLLYRLHRSGIPILEVPTVWRDVEGSKLQVTETSLEMFAALLRLRLVYSPFRWIVTFYDRFLMSGQVSEEKLRVSLLQGMGSQAVNVFNLLFHIITARVLLQTGEGVADQYGVMAAVLALSMMVYAPLGGAQAKATVSSASYRHCPRRVEGGLTVGLYMVLVVLLLGLSQPMALTFQLETRSFVVMAVLLAFAHFAFNRLISVLSARQSVRSAAAMRVFHSLLRVMFVTVLLVAGWGISGVLWGTFAATFVAFVMLIPLALPPATQHGLSPFAFLSRALKACSPSDAGILLPLTGFAVLSFADVLLVRLRFPAVTAGEYALASMMARMVIFLPMPVAVAAFSRLQGTVSHYRLLRELVVLMLSILAPASVMVLAAEWISLGVTGVATPSLVSLLRVLTVAYAPLPFLGLLLHWTLRCREKRTWTSVLPLGASGWIVLLLYLPFYSQHGVAWILFLCNVFSLLTGVLFMLKSLRRRHRSQRS